MTTIQKDRPIMTQDVANPSTVGLRSIAPSAVGLQNGAKHTPREQRPAKSTTEKGERFSGRQLKLAVGDWLKSARAAADSLNASANGLMIAKATGDDNSAALYEQMSRAMVERLLELAQVGLELAEQIQAERAEKVADETASQPNEEGAVESGTGEIPHSDAVAGALDAAVMDEGVQAVQDHVAARAGQHEPGSIHNPYIVDSLRMTKIRERAGLIEIARNPERVRLTGVDDPLTDYSQLQHVKLLNS